ncbi:MAG: SUMF1/EgtB/PvdO family nonheme iron enzyme [Verrucomicrobia bacterium]|jgi:formylglycine-generating enzyme required for sulfatase activity|nr:SUMF1/EgtB/PvdO family nonheme iron enzyme [Verrucomicrobiota bacterium]
MFTRMFVTTLIFATAIAVGEVAPGEAPAKAPVAFQLPADFLPAPGLIKDVHPRFMGVSWGVRRLRGIDLPVMQGTHPIWVVQADKEMLPGDPLAPEDMIVAIGGAPIGEGAIHQFKRELRAARGGSGILNVTRWRKGEVREVTLDLRNWPKDFPQNSTVRSTVVPANSWAISQQDNRGILNGPLMKRPPRTASDPLENLRLAIEDLMREQHGPYPRGAEFLERLGAMTNAKDPTFAALKREALMANPLLDFERLLYVRRKGLSVPQNWQGNSSIRKGARTPANALMVLTLTNGATETVYQPVEPEYVGQFDLEYDAGKVLFSGIDRGGWCVKEIEIDPATGAMKAGSLRQVSPDMGRDIDNYDAGYLPDGRIIFNSSSAYAGVPCVGGKDYVANLHIMNADGTGVRRLCFEQDNDWNPVVMGNGRVMFLRWEYTDSAHYFSRVLMTMNPDGTDQKSFYGSNSYWPNALFYPRPIPGDDAKFVGIVGSHHGSKREGPLVLFDVSKGRHEADGAVQLIGERGYEVEPLVLDRLADHYPNHVRHLTPWPLSEKYFITSAKQGRGWVIALVDVFDNRVVLKEEKGWCLIEPVPLKPRKRPALMHDRVRPDQKEATLWISDVHFGPGLRGVPKGTAKAMRVYKYEYAPRNEGGHYAMGMESGWDARTILGTVPLEEDGSVVFKVPANTPISLQPLDKDGKALAIMRSWLVGMPGEVASCVGCHESAGTAPPVRMTAASRKAPVPLTPWQGPPRGFSYTREVQPVIDTYCIGCHSADGQKKPEVVKLVKASRLRVGTGANTGKRFSEVGIPYLSHPSRAHTALHPFVRRNGPEGDYHLLTPLEFHADTSELIQMLQKGHHNVQLDAEAWDRLYTWIDLNAVFFGTWSERGAKPETLKRRLELRERYAAVDYDPEAIVTPYEKSGEVVMPEPVATVDVTTAVDKRPTVKTQESAQTVELDLGDGVTMTLARIPAGEFLMGSTQETPQEQPVTPVTIKNAYLMGTTEVTLEQYRQFDKQHLNGVYDMHYKDQVHRGYYMNHMQFPVIRVSWERAQAFCHWLSEKSGKTVKLPTEAEWEWACRAGSETAFSFGDLDADFSDYANLADLTMTRLAVSGVNPQPMVNPRPNVDYEPKDPRFHDKSLHLAPVGSYSPNAFGLFDMHGNAAEWTRSDYKAYPYAADDGRNENQMVKKVVRGGSWDDRPYQSTGSVRIAYPRWQQVYHVGFRVVIEE